MQMSELRFINTLARQLASWVGRLFARLAALTYDGWVGPAGEPPWARPRVEEGVVSYRRWHT